MNTVKLKSKGSKLS